MIPVNRRYPLTELISAAHEYGRARGRRGLEILQKLQGNPVVQVIIDDSDAQGATVDQKLPGMAGASLALSPVQAAGADAVVKTSSWDSAASTLSVPARTVAVFVQR